MKSIQIIALLCLFLSNLNAQKDSIIIDTKSILLQQNLETERYELTFKETKRSFKNLKFVQTLYQSFQVLDENNQIFYTNNEGAVSQEIKNTLFLCGTVPHYTMTTKKEGNKLLVYKDETFYDFQNIDPAEQVFEVSTTEADSILFINGKAEFNFSSNFGSSGGMTTPEMLILKKDDSYFRQDKPELKYDKVDFSDYHTVLIGEKEGLVGLLGRGETKYASIDKFEHYLAKASLPNGKEVYIDLMGNEY